MGKVGRFRNIRTVTAKLEVQYLRPVPVDEDLVAEGWEEEKNRRNLYYAGEIRDASGAVLARGKGRFLESCPSIYYGKAQAKSSETRNGIEVPTLLLARECRDGRRNSVTFEIWKEHSMDLMNNNLWRVKVGLAEMLKGGVIMDVTTADRPASPKRLEPAP